MESYGPIFSILTPCYRRIIETLDPLCKELEEVTQRIRLINKDLESGVCDLNNVISKLKDK